jgi:tetratricopeptide (TPR) repeat protein
MTPGPLYRASRLFALGTALTLLAGCGMVKTAAIKSVANTLSEGGTTVTSHDDPELVRGALDFALIMNESLLASIPKHEPLLTATCAQYTQYAAGFLQPDAEEAQFDDYERSKGLSARAFTLAQRGRGYCWRGLEVKFPGITPKLKADGIAALAKAKKEHVPLLYWSAASLGASIVLGGLDHPELLIDWPIVRALLERGLALDETWNRGAFHELMITVESQGEALGGSEERAMKHFARSVELQQNLSPGPYVALAMGIAKAKQDYAQFEKLLKQALEIDPDKDPSNRLVTLLTKKRAQILLDHIDDIILKRPSPIG